MRRSLALLTAALLVACAQVAPLPAPTPSPARTTTPPVLLPSPTPAPVGATPTPPATPSPAPERETARVVSVIDGDTVRVELRGEIVRVRYIGMDTPEMDDPRPEVRAFAEEATEINRRMVEGRVVILEKDVSETDRFGRLLRYVFVESFSGTSFVNAELVAMGYATALTIPPDVRYADLFRQLEAEAREDGRGLWGLPSPSPTGE